MNRVSLTLLIILTATGCTSPEYPNNPKGQVSLLNAELTTITNDNGTFSVIRTTWKNTGATPVKTINARVQAWNQQGSLVIDVDYTLFAVFDNQRGILPGQTYTTPADQSFRLPSNDGETPLAYGNRKTAGYGKVKVSNHRAYSCGISL
jgi:hypothetical protein